MPRAVTRHSWGSTRAPGWPGAAGEALGGAEATGVAHTQQAARAMGPGTAGRRRPGGVTGCKPRRRLRRQCVVRRPDCRQRGPRAAQPPPAWCSFCAHTETDPRAAFSQSPGARETSVRRQAMVTRTAARPTPPRRRKAPEDPRAPTWPQGTTPDGSLLPKRGEAGQRRLSGWQTTRERGDGGVTGVASPWREEGTVTLGAGDGRPPLCSAEAVGFGAHPAPGMSFLSTRYVPDPTLKHSGHRAYETDVASVLEGLGDEREAGPDRGARVTAVGPRLRPEGPRRPGQAHAATAAGAAVAGPRGVSGPGPCAFLISSLCLFGSAQGRCCSVPSQEVKPRHGALGTPPKAASPKLRLQTRIRPTPVRAGGRGLYDGVCGRRGSAVASPRRAEDSVFTRGTGTC